jgi:hypothetical protein
MNQGCLNTARNRFRVVFSRGLGIGKRDQERLHSRLGRRIHMPSVMNNGWRRKYCAWRRFIEHCLHFT